MEKSNLSYNSAYAGDCIILITKHAKSIAIAPAFWNKLQASMLEYVVDTDMLGTFSGEVERQGSALECARRKCELSLSRLGDKIDFAIASEGSFGPHPSTNFIPCDREILYFIDKKRGFHLHISHLSVKTNYRMGAVDSLESLQRFAELAQFPSHALIIRPNSRETKSPLFKGVDSPAMLEEAFYECVKYSNKGEAWVETDMRAQFNPSRMDVIRHLADKMAAQLSTFCPRCNTPGWGKVKEEKGLECSWCCEKTDLIKSEVFGCVKCDYIEVAERLDGLKQADPAQCQYCNP